MTAHTPGPWKAELVSDDYVVSAEGEHYYVARLIQGSIQGKRRHTKTAEANARLIAAAPDLMAALKQLVGLVGDEEAGMKFSDRIEMARAAIAKAEGQ